MEISPSWEPPIVQLFKNIPTFYGSRRLILEPSTGPYPEPDQSIPPHPLYLRSPISNISDHNHARGRNLSASQGSKSWKRTLLPLYWWVLQWNWKFQASTSSQHLEHGLKRAVGESSPKWSSKRRSNWLNIFSCAYWPVAWTVGVSWVDAVL
jgi:hypothetical protein